MSRWIEPGKLTRSLTRGRAAADRSDGDRRFADAELGRARRPTRPAAFPAVELGGVHPGGPVEVTVPGPRQRPGQPPPAEPGQPPLLVDGTDRLPHQQRRLEPAAQ